jgi:hypothetical protein
MTFAYDILRLFYLLLLGVNLVCFMVAVFKGNQVFKYLLIYLFAGAGSEFMSYLITDEIITVFGKKTNAPFYFLFIIFQFLGVSLFYKSVLTKPTWTRYFSWCILLVLLAAIVPYILNYRLLMVFTPWAAFITLPVLLLLNTIYFLDLLHNKKGYVLINIGIFLSLGCSLINFATFLFQDDVARAIRDFKLLLNILPLLSLHILFLYECFLYFKSQIQPSTMLR